MIQIAIDIKGKEDLERILNLKDELITEGAGLLYDMFDIYHDIKNEYLPWMVSDYPQDLIAGDAYHTREHIKELRDEYKEYFDNDNTERLIRIITICDALDKEEYELWEEAGVITK